MVKKSVKLEASFLKEYKVRRPINSKLHQVRALNIEESLLSRAESFIGQEKFVQLVPVLREAINE